MADVTVPQDCVLTSYYTIFTQTVFICTAVRLEWKNIFLNEFTVPRVHYKRSASTSSVEFRLLLKSS